MKFVNHILAGDYDPALSLNLSRQSFDVDTLVIKFAGWIGGVAGVLVFFYIVYGGFLYLTSAGNPEQTKKGGQTILNAVIGLIIVVLSYTLTVSVIKVLSDGVDTTTYPYSTHGCGGCDDPEETAKNIQNIKEIKKNNTEKVNEVKNKPDIKNPTDYK